MTDQENPGADLSAPETTPEVTADLLDELTPDPEERYKNGKPKPESAEIRDERKRYLAEGYSGRPGFAYRWQNGKLKVRKLA